MPLWSRLGCCLTGHDYAITSDRLRMFVRCRRCGHTSCGLQMAEDPVRKVSDAGRPAAPAARGAGARPDFATR